MGPRIARSIPSAVNATARPAVAVVAEAGRSPAEAQELARELSLPLRESGTNGDERFGWYLIVGKHRLELCEAGAHHPARLFVDFVGGPVGYRRISGTSRRQPLARAIGLRRGYRTVLDATAGLGRDAFQLACLGCTVVAVERSPILAALIRDGLTRATLSDKEGLHKAVNRIRLVADDARSFLSSLDQAARPDVVYLDPMYSIRSKSSLNKKEMRICRRIVGDDGDAAELLRIARNTARNRVVVKRHRTAPPLAPGAAFHCPGRRVRYDVYLSEQSPA